nr:hypothetical protein [Tanacetum cinerariifolium]
MVLVASEVGAAIVASPTRVLELDTHSSLEANPSKSSPPPVSVAPMVSPFLCLGDSESDTKIPERHVSPTPHEAMLTRWRSRVALRSSSPTTSTLEIPTASILPAPSAIVAPSSEPCRELTMRKTVRPLPSHRLAFRYTSCHLDNFTSRSSSSHSSSGHSITGHSLSGHTPPDTTDVDSSTPPRFVHPSLARTLRSLAATVISSIHATRALVPSSVDLLPPRKRFRDSISPDDSVEEDINTNVLEDIEANDIAVEAGIDAGIGMEVDVGVDVEDEVESNDRGTIEVRVEVVAGIDIPNGMLMPDVVKHLEHVEEGLQDIYDHVIEIPLQRIEDIET